MKDWDCFTETRSAQKGQHFLSGTQTEDKTSLEHEPCDQHDWDPGKGWANHCTLTASPFCFQRRKMLTAWKHTFLYSCPWIRVLRTTWSNLAGSHSEHWIGRCPGLPSNLTQSMIKHSDEVSFEHGFLGAQHHHSSYFSTYMKRQATSTQTQCPALWERKLQVSR